MGRLDETVRKRVDVGQGQDLLEAVLLSVIAQRTSPGRLLVITSRAWVRHGEGRGEGTLQTVRVGHIVAAVREEEQGDEPEALEAILCLLTVELGEAVLCR